MYVRGWFLGCAALALTACGDIQGGGTSANGLIKELPEGVLTIADPKQDLNAVKLDPSDGCYVYRHVGPVETTFIPLRTVDRRPICTKKPEPAPAS